MQSLRKRLLPQGWYPATKAETLKDIACFVKKSLVYPVIKNKKIGGVIPHAGWHYSGELAVRVISNFRDFGPELIIVFGGHLSAGETPLITIAGAWETPLGSMKIAVELANEIKTKLGLLDDTCPDNTVEIQIPLLKYYFPKAEILAVRLPASLEAARISEKIIREAQKTYKKFIILASTDLTHYGERFCFTPAGSLNKAGSWLKKNDKEFIELTLKLKTEELLKHAEDKQSACSSGAVAGLTAAAKILGAEEGKLLVYKTSCEVTLSDSCVGYAGIVF
jgi:AmmeMemoRadiSam system protein B